LVEVRQPLEQDLLRKTVQHLLMHHDALRLQFDRRHLQWSVFNAGIDDRTPFDWVDLSILPKNEAVQTIEAHASEVQASLNITDGPILRVIYYSLGKENSDRLLMVMHHLVIDGVSWRILMDDFQSIYQQLVTKKDVQLPLKTTSYKYWSEKLVEYATSRASLDELDYWTELSGKARTSLPLDYPGGENTETSGQLIQKELNVADTQSLLHDVPTAYGTEINDALLLALVSSISDWTGSRAHFVDLEGHGREDIFEDVDISRTVGWFTSIFPVYLQLVDEKDPGQALIQVKEQLRKMPNRGIGYSLLRYLCDDKTVHERLIDQPRPEISFNYLGQVDQSLPENSPFSLAPESKGTERSKSGDRMYSLIISGNISQGRLQMNWSYSSNMYRSETIDRLAEQFMQKLRELIQHCLMLDAVSYTPSDFEDVNLDQDEIDDLLEEIGGF
jgi:non-ribosomal peptide synthase protein (TIGR01720 family)